MIKLHILLAICMYEYMQFLLHLLFICQRVNDFFLNQKLTDMSFHIVDWPTTMDIKWNRFSAHMYIFFTISPLCMEYQKKNRNISLKRRK